METKIGKLLKKRMIGEIAERIEEANNLFITDCGKLSNKQIEDLKGRLRKVSCSYMTVKNSMAKRAFEQVGMDNMRTLIKDTCGIGFNKQDPVTVSKVLVDFAKENEKFQLKGAYIGGEVVSVDMIKRLATIPPREVLIARVVSSLNSPISGMVGVLSALIKNLVYALNAIKELKSSKS